MTLLLAIVDFATTALTIVDNALLICVITIEHWELPLLLEAFKNGFVILLFSFPFLSFFILRKKKSPSILLTQCWPADITGTGVGMGVDSTDTGHSQTWTMRHLPFEALIWRK